MAESKFCLMCLEVITCCTMPPGAEMAENVIIKCCRRTRLLQKSRSENERTRDETFSRDSGQICFAFLYMNHLTLGPMWSYRSVFAERLSSPELCQVSRCTEHGGN